MSVFMAMPSTDMKPIVPRALVDRVSSGAEDLDLELEVADRV